MVIKVFQIKVRRNSWPYLMEGNDSAPQMSASSCVSVTPFFGNFVFPSSGCWMGSGLCLRGARGEVRRLHRYSRWETIMAWPRVLAQTPKFALWTKSRRLVLEWRGRPNKWTFWLWKMREPEDGEKGGARVPKWMVWPFIKMGSSGRGQGPDQEFNA